MCMKIAKLVTYFQIFTKEIRCPLKHSSMKILNDNCVIHFALIQYLQFFLSHYSNGLKFDNKKKKKKLHADLTQSIFLSFI